MAKEMCGSCDARLATPVAFCPACDRPTRFASDAERLDWDLRQWRAHVDRSVAAGANSSTRAALAEAPRVAPALHSEERPAEKPRLVLAPEPAREEIAQAPASRQKTHAPRLRRQRREPQVVIDLEPNHEFAYRACATCRETDWIVRTTRNDDETWNYWCVRCSRSFKTEVRIAQAIKPFLCAGVVLGGITATSMLLLH